MIRKTLAILVAATALLTLRAPAKGGSWASSQRAKKRAVSRTASPRAQSARSLRHRRARRVAVVPGARIPRERVLEIQNALIARGHLDGSPSGVYDSETVAAMKRFQQAENLEVTGYPTAQALHRLGLSPGPTGSAQAASGHDIPTRARSRIP